MTLARAATFVCVVLALAACSEPTDTGPPAAGVRLEPAANHIFVGESLVLRATAFDSSGASMSGRPVTWTLLDTAGARLELGRASRTTPAEAVLRADPDFSPAWDSRLRVTAAVDGIADTVEIPVWTRGSVWVTNLTEVASGLPGATIQVAARAVTWGGPVEGEALQWTVVAGSGTVAPPSALTDSAGEQATSWTLGPELGYQALRVTFPGGSESSSLTMGAYAVADSTWQLSFVRPGQFCLLRLADRDLRCVPWDGTTYSWSPAGDRIAFTSGRSGNAELYLMRPDGTEQVRLTQTVANEAWPAWSPDGRWIAISSDSGRIRLIAPDGSRDTTISAPGSRDYEPSWAPDGQRLALRAVPVDSGYGYPSQIEILGLDGSRMALSVTRESGSGAYQLARVPAAWSPDGAEIAYSRVEYWGTTSGFVGRVYFVTPGNVKLTRQVVGVSPDYAPDGSALAWGGFGRSSSRDWCYNSACESPSALFIGPSDLTFGVWLAPALQSVSSPRWRPVPVTQR